MSLTLRERFDLRVSLAGIYRKSDAAEGIVTRAGLGAVLGQINLEQARNEFWREIIDKVDERDQLPKLLRQVITENDNPNYKIWLDELTTGVPTRVQKLAQSIANGQCVLFLGAGTLLCNVAPIDDPKGKRQETIFSQALAQSMAREMRDNNVYFDEKAINNLPYIAQRYNDLELPDFNMHVRDVSGYLGKVAKDFYDTCQPNTRLHELVAKLPFRVVINTNPDNELATILNNLTPERCEFRYYNMSNADGNAQQTSRPLESGQTLLYNIFGSFKERPSMIINESQLLDFTSRVVGNKTPIDPQVIDEFLVKDSVPKSYLFLGFDFDQWYVKIVFQTVLKLNKQKDSAFSIFPKGVSYSQFNRDFFEEEFKCFFIDDDLPRFLDDVIMAYHAIPPKP